MVALSTTPPPSPPIFIIVNETSTIARLALGSTVQVYRDWFTVHIYSSTTGPSMVHVSQDLKLLPDFSSLLVL